MYGYIILYDKRMERLGRVESGEQLSTKAVLRTLEKKLVRTIPENGWEVDDAFGYIHEKPGPILKFGYFELLGNAICMELVWRAYETNRISVSKEVGH